MPVHRTSERPAKPGWVYVFAALTAFVIGGVVTYLLIGAVDTMLAIFAGVIIAAFGAVWSIRAFRNYHSVS